MTPENQQIRERFDEKFNEAFYFMKYSKATTEDVEEYHDNILAFINSELALQRKTILDKIEGMKKVGKDTIHY